jgi:hypothetical protein
LLPVFQLSILVIGLDKSFVVLHIMSTGTITPKARSKLRAATISSTKDSSSQKGGSSTRIWKTPLSKRLQRLPLQRYRHERDAKIVAENSHSGTISKQLKTNTRVSRMLPLAKFRTSPVKSRSDQRECGS